MALLATNTALTMIQVGCLGAAKSVVTMSFVLRSSGIRSALRSCAEEVCKCYVKRMLCVMLLGGAGSNVAVVSKPLVKDLSLG